MVETVLVKEPLTDSMIEVGAQLTNELVKSKLDVWLAMWLFREESNRWTLFFSSPEITAKGKRPIYEQIERIRKELPNAAELPLSSIGLFPPTNPLVNALRLSLGRLSDVDLPLRYGRGAVDGQYIDDALIYRIAA